MPNNDEDKELLMSSIQELNRLIALQQQRIQSLEKVVADEPVKPSVSPRRKTYESVKHSSLKSSRSSRLSSFNFDSEDPLLEVTNIIKTDYPVLQTQVVMVGNTNRKTTGGTQLHALIIALDSSRHVHFYNAAGVEVAVVDTEHAQPVIAMAADSADVNYPVVATVDPTGAVHVIHVKMITQNEPRRRRETFELKIKASLTTKLTLPSIGSGVQADNQHSQHVTVTSLAITTKSRTGCFIYAGDSYGRITKFLCSGRLLSVLPLPLTGVPADASPSISSISLLRNHLVAAVHNTVHLVDAAKMTRLDIACATSHSITKVVQDERLGWHLLAQQDDGSIAVLNTFYQRRPAPSGSSTGGVRECVVVQLPTQDPPIFSGQNDRSANTAAIIDGTNVVGLGSVKGFFLTATDCHLALYNNSLSGRTDVNVEKVGTVDLTQYGCVLPATEHKELLGTTLHVYNQLRPNTRRGGIFSALSLLLQPLPGHDTSLTHVLVSYNTYLPSSKSTVVCPATNNPVVAFIRNFNKRSCESIPLEGLTDSLSTPVFSEGHIILFKSNMQFSRHRPNPFDTYGMLRIGTVIVLAVVLVFWKKLFGVKDRGGRQDRSVGNRKARGRDTAFTRTVHPTFDSDVDYDDQDD